MNILVLGGAGYIGSHFVKNAIKHGHKVIVADNLQQGHRKAVDPQARFYIVDIRDKDGLKQIFANHHIDACAHFAANSLVGESMQRPLVYFDNNVTGTINLLEAMEKHQVKRIVFSSSAAVYGTHERMPLVETDNTNPENPYGESKLMMEKIMAWADKIHGIRYASLRYFNVAGASLDASIGEDHRPETHLIPIILQVALGKRERLVIFGNDYPTPDGTCIRDYIHIEDLIEAHLLALEFIDKHDRSEIFNLGNEDGYSNLNVVETAQKITGLAIPFTFCDRRPGDPPKLIASSQKAITLLGWQRQYGIEDIIASAWRFHKSHPDGYKE
ncbi:MAG: UDP-glucose 4-epimerase GalE [Acholeplasmataceae bacterium]|nr:UDP-glucose 4-epimerase GalE [Acholeplasmataceae bacterium]